MAALPKTWARTSRIVRDSKSAMSRVCTAVTKSRSSCSSACFSAPSVYRRSTPSQCPLALAAAFAQPAQRDAAQCYTPPAQRRPSRACEEGPRAEDGSGCVARPGRVATRERVLPAGSPQASVKASTNEQLLERIEAEIAFAKGLAGLTPARAAEWNPLIARADDIVRAMKAGGMRGDGRRRS